MYARQQRGPIPKSQTKTQHKKQKTKILVPDSLHKTNKR